MDFNLHMMYISLFAILLSLIAVGLSEGKLHWGLIVLLFALCLVPLLNVVVFAAVAMHILWQLYSRSWMSEPKKSKEQK